MQIITTHRGTDFDGLASLVAGTLLYPGVVPVLPKTLNPNVKAFLSIHKDLFEMSTIDDIDLGAVDQLIVVDANRWDRLDRLDGLRKRNDLDVLLWDHHENHCDISTSWKCQERIGANITLMVREIKKNELKISPIQATLFLSGIYEDTGSLMFPSSTAEDAYAAAYLLEKKSRFEYNQNLFTASIR